MPQLRAIAAALLILLAASPQAHATAEHTYAKGEYPIIAGGWAPNQRLAIAVHGEGEGAHDRFHAYLMSEPQHRRLAVLDNISHENNLDTDADAYYAEWSPDSRYVAVSFRTERHIMTLNIYAIEGDRARLIGTPDLFRKATGRTVVVKTDGDMRTYVPTVTWRGPRRYDFNDYRLFVEDDRTLADKIDELCSVTRMEDGRYSIEFAAHATVRIGRGKRNRIGKLRLGVFQR
ncbi:hypothetical protein A5906_17775 [Bradyrhizobium sacchari]|uniref:Uncharacterized protein n=1 Tax=Bradyrhizobium sacchari TaxID=1399419 RepID=A0A560JD50_9BRAD|nr:hypothetical protein [Bradyrhizobium sacchari]OPY93641.1 hypothetical protein A5906_17775 [Bradyrhizobium sacchari]TWB50816.1 hypothetical protein FBZ94_111148 [Bradyrhizobium sacchari]TWB68976.1 hypothetical protein FBZ95_11096 [Bradyrhizobium sacchari]